MNKFDKKKSNVIGFLIAIIVTGIFMFALLSRLPIYGIASDVIVMLPEGKSQSYANHVTGNIAGIIQNTFDDRKVMGRPTSIIVKNAPTSGLININVYGKDTAEAFKLHKTLINAIEKEVLVYYPKTTGIKIKSVGQSYKTTKLSYVFGVILISIIVGWLLTRHISGLMDNFFPRVNIEEDDEYNDVGAPSRSFIERMSKKKKDDSIKNVSTGNEREIAAYTWSDLGGAGSAKDTNNEISEDDKNYNTDETIEEEAAYTEAEKRNYATTEEDALENDVELNQESSTPKTEFVNHSQSENFSNEIEEYVKNENFVQRGVENENVFDDEVLNNDEVEIEPEVNIAQNINGKSKFTENEINVSQDNFVKMPENIENNNVITKEAEYEKDLFDEREELTDVESDGNFAQTISNEPVEADREFYTEKKMERVSPQSPKTSENNLEGIDSERNNEYLNSLGPMGFDRVGDVKIPNGAYEYIPKDHIEKSADTKRLEEIRNDFNNALASIGGKKSDELPVEKKDAENQFNEIRDWADVSDEVSNQFRNPNLTEGEMLNLNEDEPFKEVEHTSNEVITEVDENIFSNCNDASNLKNENSEIEKAITGGLALPEIEEKYEDAESKKKKEALEVEKIQRQKPQKNIANSGATAFAPGNLPIVDMGFEVAQEETEQVDEIDKEGSEMVAKLEGEPSDEDLKRRLNELLNGAM